MEQEIGKVVHYYDRIGVAVVRLSQPLEHGDQLHFKGSATDVNVTLESMQIDHKSVDKAVAGSEVAVKVDQKVKEGDVVFKVS